MLEKLVIATSNKHKLKEIEELFNGNAIKEILPIPSDIGEIIEDGKTFIENSFIKARAVYNHTKLPSLADDSGLCINALNGNPGIYSARYGGENLSYEEKMQMIIDIFLILIYYLLSYLMNYYRKLKMKCLCCQMKERLS